MSITGTDFQWVTFEDPLTRGEMAELRRLGWNTHAAHVPPAGEPGNDLCVATATDSDGKVEQFYLYDEETEGLDEDEAFILATDYPDLEVRR